MHRMAAILALTVLAGAADAPGGAVARAKAAWARGDVEGVLFALTDEPPTAPPARKEAARLLVAVARAKAEAGDLLLGLQACQMALRFQTREADALEVCAQVSRRLDQFGSAERYARRLADTHPRDPRGWLWLARLALEQGEWGEARSAARRALTLAPAPDLRREAEAIAGKADAALSARQEALSQVTALAEAPRREATRSEPRAPAGGAPAVVLYSTAWCGYCKKARRWLKSKGVAFEERDIERDPEALAELVEKARAIGVRPRGVPVLDVGGRLVLGWDPSALEQALEHAGLLP